MEKALPGSFHATFEFCSAHWKGLIAASLLPVLILAAGTALAWIYMGDLFSILTLSRFNQTKDYQQHMISMMGTIWLKLVLLGLISAFVSAWHFTRVAMFWRDEYVSPFSIKDGELSSTAMLIAYYIGVTLVIALCYLLIVLVAVVVFLITRAIFGEGIVVGIVLGVAGIVALIALFIVCTRFLLAFPQIALGRRPNIFTEMLPLAKGEVWSGFWRLLVFIGAFVVLSWVLQLIFVMPLAEQLSGQLFESSGAIDPNVLYKISAALAPYLVLAQLFGAIAVTFVCVFLIEMNSRLQLKDTGVALK